MQPKKPAPAGVNQRTAVLFTRKKQQAISSAEIEETESTPNKTDAKKKGVIQALTDETLENQETEVQGAASNPATTSNSINLDKTGFEKPAGKKRGRKSKAEKEQLDIDKSIKVIGMKIPNSVSSSMQEHKCKLCPKSFYFEGSLKIHMGKMHLKSFLCAWCNLRFADKQSCKEHIETVHRKLKKYKCKKCPKAFFLRGTLKKHLDVDHLTSKSEN